MDPITKETDMSDALDLAEAHNRAFNDRAWQRAPEIYSPDLVTVEPGGQVIHGIDDFLAYGKGFAEAFPDSRNEVLAITVQGNRAVVEGTYKGTHTGPLASPQGVVPPTGRTLALRFCEIFEVEAGRIATHRTYYDQMEFAQQLGLIPATA
jgi:steroid delta-isomerase-like uncharacterized protein